ncbi:hypothetical protein [Thermanaerothrix sp.]|uniref:hypothetical protein n=1 Tax=Thermanaerothrix sp. TaxID=2972675 RepID=UPI002ADDBAC6|nr:hypothetical protein [Thermanaerothrix sp.]
MTDFREYAGLLDDLPRDIGALVQVVQGLSFVFSGLDLRGNYERDPRWKMPRASAVNPNSALKGWRFWFRRGAGR